MQTEIEYKKRALKIIESTNQLEGDYINLHHEDLAQLMWLSYNQGINDFIKQDS